MTLIVRRSHVLQHVLPRMSRVSFEPAKQVVVGFSTVTVIWKPTFERRLIFGCTLVFLHFAFTFGARLSGGRGNL